MSKRYITLADLANPEGYHERRFREEDLSIRREANALKAQVEAARIYQADVHHNDKMREAGRQHRDKMRAIDESNELAARRIDLAATESRARLQLDQDELDFKRENAATIAQTARDAALIQARTTLAVANMQQQGAIALSELNHRQDVALSGLEHLQALDVVREQSRLASADATTNILREKAHSTIRRGEDAAKHMHAAIGSILVEKVRGRVAGYLEDQKERHRTNERKHEREMAEYTARYARVGFTAAELVRAGFSIKEATVIVERFVAGAGAQDDDEAAIFAKFDRWYGAGRQ